MKKLAVLLFIISPLFLFGQEDGNPPNELGAIAVNFEVDEDYFPIKTPDGQAFYSEDYKAAIMGQLLPISFEQMELEYNTGSLEQGGEVVEKDILTLDGKRFLFVKMILKDKGDTYLTMYARQNDDSTSILVSGFYGPGHDAEKMDAYTKTAALSAAVKQ